MYTLAILALLFAVVDPAHAAGNCANGVCSANAARVAVPPNPMNWGAGACSSGSCSTGSCSTGSCAAVSARRSRGSCSSSSGSCSSSAGVRRGIIFHRR